MLKLPSLTILASLAALAPAQAQIFVPANSVTLSHSGNNGCSLQAGQVYSNGTGELIVGYTNTGTNWIAFSVQVMLVGTGFTRVIQSTHTNARPPGAGVVRIPGLTPALPESLSNAGASVTIQYCSTAPDPGGPPRNWR
ncbi:hypothetical protein [Falsiroseomonas sp.]|uniref:hypothetical protein n=1 Tax=Falsiroseomonas sp. TaxID=2870721 RepID=UPI0027377885|nr:hypothetical protein [Falsiroseomonas sp.]MDP3416452.1 hypothetical protein [Falsiroseomonas sp.]